MRIPPANRMDWLPEMPGSYHLDCGAARFSKAAIKDLSSQGCGQFCGSVSWCLRSWLPTLQIQPNRARRPERSAREVPSDAVPEQGPPDSDPSSFDCGRRLGVPDSIDGGS